jgi:hypothetical protein
MTEASVPTREVVDPASLEAKRLNDFWWGAIDLALRSSIYRDRPGAVMQAIEFPSASPEAQ